MVGTHPVHYSRYRALGTAVDLMGFGVGKLLIDGTELTENLRIPLARALHAINTAALRYFLADDDDECVASSEASTVEALVIT